MGRPRNPDGPKAAMVRSTIALMRRQGVAATSVIDVLADSGAPRGSAYHHFPGGRTQLIEEATAQASEQLTAAIGRVLAASDTPGALEAFADLWRRGLVAGDYAVGCPIVAAALGTERPARDLAGQAFATWSELLAARLVADGAGPAEAASLGTLAVAALEGALVMAQAARSPAPIDTVLPHLIALCRAAVGRAGQSRGE